MSEGSSVEPLGFSVEVPVTIRKARRADLSALEWFGMFTEHREIIERTFAQQAHGEQLMLVADARSFPIGQAWLDLAGKRRDGAGIVWAVRVFPAFQGIGIGARIMEAAERALRALGFSCATLGVERTNALALRFYERLGYEVTGEALEEHRYTTPDGQHIVRPVDQWLLTKELR